MTYNLLRIGTRKSPLALAQANQVRDLLLGRYPHLSVELVSIVTSGDRITDRTLADVGGKGLFTKEIEEALLANTVDIAVHSMKDMQTVLPDGLLIGCVLPREDARDMLVGEGIASINDLPKGAVIGTASLRRASQLLILRPDLSIVPLRGNVETRLAKLKSGEMRATLLAVAGLKRLGLTNVPGVILPVDTFIPAVAQGAIGIECRANDAATLELLKPFLHRDTDIAVRCERAFLKTLDGSCRTPIAGYAEIKGADIHFRGLLAQPDGSSHHAVGMSGDASHPESLGEKAGKALLAKTNK